MSNVKEPFISEQKLINALKESDYTFLLKLRDRISELITGKQTEYEEQESLKIKRDSRVREILIMMQDDGLSPADLASSTVDKKRKHRRKTLVE